LLANPGLKAPGQLIWAKAKNANSYRLEARAMLDFLSVSVLRIPTIHPA